MTKLTAENFYRTREFEVREKRKPCRGCEPVLRSYIDRVLRYFSESEHYIDQIIEDFENGDDLSLLEILGYIAGNDIGSSDEEISRLLTGLSEM